MTDPLIYGHATFDDHEVRAMSDTPRTAAGRDADALLDKWAGLVDQAQELMRSRGFVIDKWPVADHRGPWSNEELAALDPEVRWQGFAFGLYTDLAMLHGDILRLREDDGGVVAIEAEAREQALAEAEAAIGGLAVERLEGDGPIGQAEVTDLIEVIGRDAALAALRKPVQPKGQE